ncbi:MAG: MerR family transcriptional regulator [Polymorphobacter sp.]
MAIAATDKSERAFRTISEAAETVGVPQHVLRFWETRFPQLQPLKSGGNRRYYRPADMALLETIRAMLHDQGLTIRGAKLALAGGNDNIRAAPAPAKTTKSVAASIMAPMPDAPVSAVAASIDIARLIAIRDRLRRALAA